MSEEKVSMRHWINLGALAMTFVTGASLFGCGGGASNPAGTATRATKDRVLSIQTHNAKNFSFNSNPNSTASFATNASSNNSPTVSSPGSPVPPASIHSPYPFIGAFLHGGFGFGFGGVPGGINAIGLSAPSGGIGFAIGASSPPGRKARTREAVFYYDEYLGLWVDYTSDSTSVTSFLYEDQAKTKPAGSIKSNFPNDYVPGADFSYSSSYSFTAGALKGSSGEYDTIFKSDGSGSSSYRDTETDGSTSVGSSVQNSDGSSHWSSKYTSSKGYASNESGSFNSDGSGKAHYDSSDGYATDYQYNSDGSGSGKVSGPEPGLPAVIVWDANGNVTITYADGTTEHFQTWGISPVEPNSGSGDALPGSVGGSTGTVSSGNTGK